jgi:hypothetical protein
VRVRRLIAVAALVGAGLGFGAVSASPAEAYCQPPPMAISNVGSTTNSCQNTCPDAPLLLKKLGMDWECPM